MIANFFEVQYINHQNKRTRKPQMLTKAIFPRMFISIMPITLTANAAIVQYSFQAGRALNVSSRAASASSEASAMG